MNCKSFRYLLVCFMLMLIAVQESKSEEIFNNSDACVEWKFSDPQTINETVITPAKAFSVATIEHNATTVGSGSRSKDPDNGLKFVTFTGENVQLHWFVKPSQGLTFTPTQIRMYVQRFGTNKKDGVVVTTQVEGGETTTLGTYTARRANWDDSQEEGQWKEALPNLVNEIVIDLTADQQKALASGNGLHLYATTGLAAEKSGGFADIRIYGKVDGTMADVAKYSLATQATPSEGGTVTKLPDASEYEVGSEVTLTANKNFGYQFVNWTDDKGNVLSTESKYKHSMNSNATITANFKAVNTYELKLNVEGTNQYMVEISPEPTIVDNKNMYEEGVLVKLNATQYEGLVSFSNWSDDDTNSEKTVTMSSDMTLTAHYNQAEIIAGWDFYQPGGNGRKADFYGEDNEGTALNLVNTETGETSGWLDKSWIAAKGYESFKGAAVNWRAGSSEGDVGHWHWQTKVNAEAFSDINVQFQMLYNYNAYQTYQVEFSTDGNNWTKAGSITMEGAKKPATFNEKLPSEANNVKDLFIRLIADKQSAVDGSKSVNDGNTLAMLFVTGTKKLIDDGKAPVLVSVVPAQGSTGASASGKIILSFDERVQLKEGTKGMLNGVALSPVVSGKTIAFEYHGLDYATEYTFTLAANTIGDLTDNYLSEELQMKFSTMSRPEVAKGSFDAVVSNVSELVEAIKKAEQRSNKNTRFRIFLKKGTYQLPKGSTDVTYHVELADGSTNSFTKKDPITRISSGNISFIGENRDEVIITNTIPADETFDGKYGTTSVYEGIGKSDVLQTRGEALYYQDLTVSTGMDDARGRDIAIEDMGTKTIYKNVCLHGYQDTWVGQNDRGLYYFEGGVVRGRTDYMCGKGDAYFNSVELKQIAGGYASVPSRPAKIGWVYKDCTINGDGNNVDGNYTLGRPWGEGTPVALFIDTKMNVVPSSIGWNEMNNGWPARFAEWNSMTKNGSAVDLSGRKTTFANSHTNNPLLTQEEAETYSDMSKMFGDWNPRQHTEQAPAPKNVVLKGNQLTWDDSKYVLCWAVCKDGDVIDFTTEPIYTIPSAAKSNASGTAATYSVRAANEMGGLSEAVSANEDTGINNVEMKTYTNEAIYNMQGMRVDKATKGVYIIGGRKMIIK